MTPLDKSLKRSLHIQGVDYVVTLSPDGLKLTRKGRRLGLELKWSDLVSGESALAVALHASVGRFESGKEPPLKKVADEAPSMSAAAKPGASRRSPMKRRR